MAGVRRLAPRGSRTRRSISNVAIVLVPISTAIVVASLAGVAISQTDGPSGDDPTAGLDLENRPRGIATPVGVPAGNTDYGPTPQAGNFPVSLATGCSVEGPAPSQLDENGQRDLSKVPRWVRVGGQDAAGQPGVRGCVARELVLPMFDSGAAYNRLAERAGTRQPPFPVFWPDGTLTGYVSGRFRLIEQAIAEGSVPQGFLERPPVPTDFEPNASPPALGAQLVQLPIPEGSGFGSPGRTAVTGRTAGRPIR